MTRTRIVGGKIIETTGGDYNIYTKENIVYSAATTISETAVENGVSYGNPEKAPTINTNIDFDITFEIDKTSKEIVPFGIANFENKTENPFIKFNYKLIGTPIDSLSFEILDDDGNTIFAMTYLKEIVIQAENKSKIQKEFDSKSSSQEFKVYDFKEVLSKYFIEEPDYTKTGNYSIYWDGFDTDEIYESTRFNGKKLKAKILATKGNQRKQVEIEFETKYNEVNWVDVKIDKKSKRIDTTLRVNLKDGGANGLECNETLVGVDGLTITECPWDDIPASQINPSKPVIRTRTKSYQDLEKLAIDGLNYHWGRNRNHSVAKNIIINGEAFEVYIDAINTQENAMDYVNLVYNTNQPWLRSMNPGSVNSIKSFFGNIMFQRIVYNVGYMKGDKSWYWMGSFNDVDNDFSFTSAHEIGHEILKLYATDAFYSYKHKGSSTLSNTIPTNKGGFNYPTNGEIDLMKYYNNDPRWYDFKRIAASENDVLGLIWLTKINIL